MSTGLRLYDQYGEVVLDSSFKTPRLVLAGSTTLKPFPKGAAQGTLHGYHPPIAVLPESVTKGYVDVRVVSSSMNTECIGILSSQVDLWRYFTDYTFVNGKGYSPTIDPNRWMGLYVEREYQAGNRLYIDGSSSLDYQQIRQSNGTQDRWHREATVEYMVFSYD